MANIESLVAPREVFILLSSSLSLSSRAITLGIRQIDIILLYRINEGQAQTGALLLEFYKKKNCDKY